MISDIDFPHRKPSTHKPAITVSLLLGTRSPRKNSISHIDASLSRQPLVKGERLVRNEVNAVMLPFSSEHQPSLRPVRRHPFACWGYTTGTSASKGSARRLLRRSSLMPKRYNAIVAVLGNTKTAWHPETCARCS